MPRFNRYPKFDARPNGARPPERKPKRRLGDYAPAVIGVLIILIITALWATSPERKFNECSGTNVPRHCVE